MRLQNASTHTYLQVLVGEKSFKNVLRISLNENTVVLQPRICEMTVERITRHKELSHTDPRDLWVWRARPNEHKLYMYTHLCMCIKSARPAYEAL